MKNMHGYFSHIDKLLIHTETKYKNEILFSTFPFISERTRKHEVKSIEALRIDNCDDGWNIKSIDEYCKLKRK
jgi:hypothetical protein